MKKNRKISGNTCKLEKTTSKKGEAKKKAESLRKSGKRASVISSKEGYGVYSCGKSKRKK